MQTRSSGPGAQIPGAPGGGGESPGTEPGVQVVVQIEANIERTEEETCQPGLSDGVRDHARIFDTVIPPCSTKASSSALSLWVTCGRVRPTAISAV